MPLYRLARAAAVAVVALAASPGVLAGDAAQWLARAAQAARQLNYAGTIVYQHGAKVETSRLVHLFENGAEYEKLVSLDGPAREVIRSQDEVRCYYPDAKVVRIEPRTFRNAFPSLSAQQQKALAEHYQFRRAEPGRVAGIEAQSWVFEPKDGLRYGHTFWADTASGLLLKARIIDERGEVVEQFAFTDLAIGARIDREQVRPSWAPTPADWVVRAAGPGDVELRATGWSVGAVPPGFTKIVEGYRALRGRKHPVAHLVYSDGLVAVSVFIENVGSAPHPTGLTQQGGTHIFVRQQDDHLITVLGEAPAATMRQIAASVSRR
jgi:sigma-E factor negative regulatory protein RseB